MKKIQRELEKEAAEAEAEEEKAARIVRATARELLVAYAARTSVYKINFNDIDQCFRIAEDFVDVQRRRAGLGDDD